MFKKKIIFCLCISVFTVMLLASKSSAQTSHEYVGVAKCGLCRKKDDVGAQLKIWQQSKHAKAFETLGTPEAKALGAKMEIDDPQKSGKCLKCHSTAYGFSESKVTESVPVEEGVSCESCHGPGKDYMKKSVMQDKEQAKANGLIIPNEKTCVKCHNPESPAFKEFNFKERWAQIKHPVPPK